MKIYIDTNIFLNMYRSHMQKDIKTIMNLIRTNKSLFITTAQTMHELSRNRRKTVENFKNELNKTKLSNQIIPYVKMIDKSNKLKKAQTEYNNSVDAAVERLNEISENKEKDIIYSSILKIFKSDNIIPTKEHLFQRAHERKLLGNPPSSDKYTIGDELIWEILVDYGRSHNNALVIVSADGTFRNDSEYLINEYEFKCGSKLHIFKDLIDALKFCGINIPDEAITSQENVTWTTIIKTALENLGGEASLNEIYSEIMELMYFVDYGKKMDNKEKESTIRGILQRFSSDCESSYNGNVDLFKQIGDGVWGLR